MGMSYKPVKKTSVIAVHTLSEMGLSGFCWVSPRPPFFSGAKYLRDSQRGPRGFEEEGGVTGGVATGRGRARRGKAGLTASPGRSFPG